MPPLPPRIPLWLKVGFTIWVVVWMVLFNQVVGWQHFLWMCHLGHILIMIGLWLENPLLLSWQALALLFADLVWAIDFICGLVARWHPLGAAAYMFNEAEPPLKRALALYHPVMPILLIWLLVRLGYDRRAIWLQTVTCWILFPITFLVTDPKDNVNWVFGTTFANIHQHVSPPVYLLIAMVLYVLALYVPSHLVLMLLFPRPRRVEPVPVDDHQ